MNVSRPSTALPAIVVAGLAYPSLARSVGTYLGIFNETKPMKRLYALKQAGQIGNIHRLSSWALLQLAFKPEREVEGRYLVVVPPQSGT